MDDSLEIKLGPQEAALVASGIVLILLKGNRHNNSSRLTEVLALRVLNKLVLETTGIDNIEVTEIVDTALNTAMSLSGEVYGREIVDVFPTQVAEKCM